MAFPLVVQKNTPINARPDQRMATGRVVQAFVRQPINLNPGGNTVAMTVRSENPFEGGRSITVTTQASGGMAKPDRQMQSRRLQGQHGLGGWTTRPHAGGFRGLNGLGDSVSDEELTQWYRAYDEDGKAGRAITPEKEAYWTNEILKSRGSQTPPVEESKPFDWAKAGDIFTSTVKTGADIYSQVAKKDLPSSVQSYMPRATPAKSNTMLYVALGGVAVLGVLFFVLRKKGGAAPAA